VRVHPVVFHRVLDLPDAAGWQVRQGEHDLTVLVAAPGPGVDVAAVDRSVRVALAAAGARVPVTVAVVDAIPAGAAGKRPLVVAFPGAPVPEDRTFHRT
jgi:phenylacetate-CoA ligase